MKNTKGFMHKYRKKLGLTQEQMAKKLYLSYNTYLSYEHGVRQAPVDVCIRVLELSGEKNDYKIIECLKKVYYGS
jgi:DNA-binding XRE family transcriptional regulator